MTQTMDATDRLLAEADAALRERMEQWLREMIEAREAAEVNVPRLARELEMHPQTIYRIESGVQRFDQAFYARWMSTVRQIARQRAEAVGAL